MASLILFGPLRTTGSNSAPSSLVRGAEGSGTAGLWLRGPGSMWEEIGPFSASQAPPAHPPLPSPAPFGHCGSGRARGIRFLERDQPGQKLPCGLGGLVPLACPEARPQNPCQLCLKGTWELVDSQSCVSPRPCGRYPAVGKCGL